MKMTSTNMLLGLVIITGMVMTINSYQLSAITISEGVTGTMTAKAEVDLASGLAYKMPVGSPKIYGSELGVSYDDVDPNDAIRANQVISKLKSLDTSIKLEGADKDRYINILYKMENGISCEYCCGARSIIFENGEPACGCAHSFAMRGLAKYLITKHGSDYTDSQILEEIGKWKALFFPTQIANKAKILSENNLDTDMISLTSNKYRGVEKQIGGSSAGGMVGGC